MNALPPVIFRRLHMLVGLPRSGKTTWALSTGWPIVNPDAIRVAIHGQRFLATAEPLVWAIAKTMVRSLFLAGHSRVVLDATNVTAARRAEWEGILEGVEVVPEVVLTSPDECIRRALSMNDHEIVPVIERMAAQWDWPIKWEPLVEIVSDRAPNEEKNHG